MKRPAKSLLLAAIFFFPSPQFVTKAAAQQNPRTLPRVGVIGKWEDGNTTWEGCANHFLVMRNPVNKSLADRYIFISNTDGSIAWMNLDGRDVRLELAQSTLWYPRSGRDFAQYKYRAGNIQITVSFPKATDYISAYRATIWLRKGQAGRTINASGMAQCD